MTEPIKWRCIECESVQRTPLSGEREVCDCGENYVEADRTYVHRSFGIDFIPQR